MDFRVRLVHAYIFPKMRLVSCLVHAYIFLRDNLPVAMFHFLFAYAYKHTYLHVYVYNDHIFSNLISQIRSFTKNYIWRKQFLFKCIIILKLAAGEFFFEMV